MVFFQAHLSFRAYQLPDKLSYPWHFIPYMDTLEFKILRGFKIHHDDSLFSFKRLFDIHVFEVTRYFKYLKFDLEISEWSILFIFLVLSTALMIIISENLWSFYFILINQIQLFTSQSSKFTDSIIFGLKLSRFKIMNLIILTTIWLQSASIITKPFTGLLLSTFSSIIYIPIADSFEDIYQDQSLELHSRLIHHVDYLATSLKINSKIIDNLVEREAKFRNQHKVSHFAIRMTADIFKEIVTGKLIVICQTTERKIFEAKFTKWKSILSVSDNIGNL